MTVPEVIDLSAYLAGAGRASWDAVAELADIVPIEQWLIVGGQMVTIHAAAHGALRHRVTADADIVVDVRAARRQAMVRVSEALTGTGFGVESSPDGVSRFVRGVAVIDLLAPEGLRRPVATIGAGWAVAAPGATQALQRAEPMTVGWDDRSITVRCPTLLGAIVAKAAGSTEIPSATHVSKAKHQVDLVLLLDLAARFGLPAASDLTRKDRSRLRAAMDPLLADDRHSAWAATDTPGDVRDVVAHLLGDGA